MKYLKTEGGYLVESESKEGTFYNVSLDFKSCTCPVFKYFLHCKGMCKHMSAVANKEKKDLTKETKDITFTDGSEAFEFVDKYGEEKLNFLKKIGEVYEKNGKLFKI